MTARPLAIGSRSSRPAARAATLALGWIAGLAAAVVRSRRNARAAAWLEGQPDYLLQDIGIDRSAVADIRRRGLPPDLPSELPPAFWPRPRC